MELNNLRKNKVFSSILALSMFALQASPVLALPQNPEVIAGTATFVYTPDTFTATTPSDRLIVDYDSFSSAAQESVIFAQPSSSAIALNRVKGTDPSVLLGKLSANGRVFVVNPNGVLFGASSRVDTAGLLASTLNISNQDFLAGNYNFTQNGSPAYVINQGQINITNGGYAVLLGNAISNAGSIVANLGKVILAAGEKMTVALDDANDIAVTIDEAVKNKVFGPDGKEMKGAITNTGTISTEGGKVLLTAKTLNNIFNYAVNNAGVIEAKSLVNRNGKIELLGDGGSVIVSTGSKTSAKAGEDTAQGGEVIIKSSKNAIAYSGATIDVSGGLIGGDAGFIEVSGQQSVGLYSTQLYTNAAANFKRGVVLIDPRDIIIQASAVGVTAPGDNANGTADIDFAAFPDAVTDIAVSIASLTALSASEVYLQAARDIFINDNLTLTSALKLEAGNNINVNANVTTSGQAITLTADADQSGAGVVITALGKTITSGGGNISLNSGTAMTLGSINAGAGTLILNARSGGATQVAGTSLTAANLALSARNEFIPFDLNATPGVGNFTLTEAGNNVGTISAKTNGSVSYKDADALTVGIAGGINGIITNNANITLDTGNTLTLSKNISAGTGDVSLNTAAGGVNQTDRLIVASNLLLTGTGNFNLASVFNNSIDTVAANITGSLSLKETNALTIGTVGGVEGITTTNSNVTLNTGGAITLSQKISAGNGRVTLNPSSGGVSQAVTGIITAKDLVLTGGGPIILDTATNDIDNVSASFSGGAFSFKDGDGLGVGVDSSGISVSTNNITLTLGGALALARNISSSGTTSITMVGGVTQSTGNMTGSGSLKISGTGDVVLPSASNSIATLAVNTNGALTYRDNSGLILGTVSGTSGITASSVALTAASSVTQTAPITTNDLSLSGTGSYTLNNASNNVATLAADTTKAVRYTDSNALTVGTVGAINGIVNDDDVAINSGALTISQAISTQSGNLLLNVAGVTQTASITTEEFGVNGTGTFTLNHASNNAVSFAANTVGALSYTDSNALTIGSVNGTNGVTTGNNDFTLNTGALTISQAINAGTGTAILTSAGASQTAAITADKLALNGTGTFALTSANDVATLAANVAGALNFKDANSLTVGTVGALSNITTGNNALALTADDLTLTGTINSGSANTAIAQTTNGKAIDLGTNTVGQLGLTDVEIDNITAAQLIIGNSNTGAITVSDNVNPANITNLNVVSGAGINGTVSKTLTIASLTASAATGIGASNALNTGATSLSLSSTNGNVAVNNSNAATATISNVSTGTGDVNFVQSGGGALSVTSASTGSGALALSNTGANLTAVSVSAGGALKNASLTTNTSGNVLVGNVTAAGDSITITSAGSIEESGADIGDDLTASVFSLTAASGIGALGAIETAGSSLAASSTSGNIVLSNTGDLTLGVVGTSGNVTLSSTASLLDDANQSSRVSAGTVNLTATTAIGGAGSNADLDTDVNFINATAGSNIYLNENNAVELSSLTSTAGLASLVAGGAVSLKGATTQNSFTARATTGDITFDGTVTSNAGGVNAQADNGSILAVGNITHVTAKANSSISATNGTVTTTGQALGVNVTGNLTLNIGGAGANSANLNGTVTGAVALDQSSAAVPLRPAGNVFFNGNRIWPNVINEAVSQASNGLINRPVLPGPAQLNGSQILPFDQVPSGVQTGPVFLYHPLTQLDSSAFDQDFKLEEGAYDFIDGRIEEKKKNNSKGS